MSFDFDVPAERAGTWSTRWDRYAGRDVIPLWVADSDFRAEKRELAVCEYASHECVTFGGDVHANPEQRQFGVQQVQSKQETAFSEPTHGDLAR